MACTSPSDHHLTRYVYCSIFSKQSFFLLIRWLLEWDHHIPVAILSLRRAERSACNGAILHFGEQILADFFIYDDYSIKSQGARLGFISSPLTTLILVLGKLRQVDLSEFETTVVHRVSFRTVSATEQNPSVADFSNPSTQESESKDQKFEVNLGYMA